MKYDVGLTGIECESNDDLKCYKRNESNLCTECIDGYYLKSDNSCDLITTAANSSNFDFCLRGIITAANKYQCIKCLPGFQIVDDQVTAD